MSTDRDWTLTEERLKESLAIWHRDHEPDDATRERVNNWLLDLPLDPLGMGAEDPERRGIWHGRVPRTNVGVVYVPDPKTRKIAVALIAPG